MIVPFVYVLNTWPYLDEYLAQPYETLNKHNSMFGRHLRDREVLRDEISSKFVCLQREKWVNLVL